MNSNHFGSEVDKVILPDDFAITAITNLFAHERLKMSEAYSEPSRTSKMDLSANLVYY